MDEFTGLPHGHPVDASVLAKIISIRARAKGLEKQAKALMFPEGMKRTKIANPQRLIIRADNDFNIPFVVELKRVLDFAMDLEQRCEAVLNNLHPQSESGSVFDAVREGRALRMNASLASSTCPSTRCSRISSINMINGTTAYPFPSREEIMLNYSTRLWPTQPRRRMMPSPPKSCAPAFALSPFDHHHLVRFPMTNNVITATLAFILIVLVVHALSAIITIGTAPCIEPAITTRLMFLLAFALSRI
jgi:hypothetical protein